MAGAGGLCTLAAGCMRAEKRNERLATPGDNSTGFWRCRKGTDDGNFASTRHFIPDRVRKLCRDGDR